MASVQNAKKKHLPLSYKTLLKEIKNKVKSSQLKAALSVNRELINLYWEIGRSIQSKQKEEGWGAKTIAKLARDLKLEFPGMKGLSPRNIQYMVTFSKEYPDFQITQQLVAQIPWGHNTLLLDKLADLESRIWYVNKTIENGWSRNTLLHWIDSGLYEKKGRAINNFDATLPNIQSDLARETIKDPYNFDFLTLREKFDEKELEDGLLDHIQKFLLELGHGFAFLGRQYPLTIDREIYPLDLLFYHTKLHCYIIVELKAKPFDPRDIGQINFYLSAVDDLLKAPEDNKSIGLLLCKGKNGVKVEYTLRGMQQPIGVAEYETKILESLPKGLKSSLPTIEEIEEELKRTD